MTRHNINPAIGETTGAFRYDGEGHARGKVVIAVDEDTKQEP
jgi:hypothetical protein